MPEDNKSIDFFNSAIFISVVTADIYLSAFEYERGYCDFFNVPNYLIEVSVTGVLAFAGSAILLFSLIMNLSGLFMPIVRRIGKMENGYWKSTLASNIAALLLVLFLFMIYPLSKMLGYAILSIFLGTNIAGWILSALLSLKEEKP